MIRKLFITFLLILCQSFAWSADNVKVIFLSRPKSAFYQLPLPFQWVSRSIAQAGVECEPFGDGCFHPQLGFIEDPEKVQKANVKKNLDEGSLELKTINSEEVNLVNCDKDYHFDLFCGKAKAKKAKENVGSPYQVWIDISSSMRVVDYSNDPSFCERRRFVGQIRKECGDKLDIYTFNTGRQTMGGLETLCINRGTNDGSRMVQWLKNTEAKSVLIITDVDEYVGEFQEYLETTGAEVVGIGVKPVYADELFTMTGELKKICL